MKRSQWLILALMALAQFMVVLDLSVANIALPAIQRTLHFGGTSSLQWVITAYGMAFGGFMLLGGRAADLFGRRRVLVLGLANFTLFSLLVGLAPTAPLLVAFRALQGLSAAFMPSAALSIVLTTFREGRTRNTALSIWAAIASGGAAVGLLVGGTIVEYLSWRWNFLVNVPIGLLAALAILRFVPPHRTEASARNLDIPGAVLVTTGLMTLVYGFAQAPMWGWMDGRTGGVLALGLLLLLGFIYNETRDARPLVPLSIFRIRNVTGANLIAITTYACMMSMFFLTSLYVQGVRHYSPVLSGLSFLPAPIMIGFTATRVPRLVRRIGYRPLLIAGPLLLVSGLVLLSRLSVDSSYLTGILPSLLLLPMGAGMTMVAVNIAATSGVPGEQAGLASGLINTSLQMGGALGLSILSSIAASVALPIGSPASLVNGYDIAYFVGAVFALIGLALAVTVIRQQPQADTPATR